MELERESFGMKSEKQDRYKMTSLTSGTSRHAAMEQQRTVHKPDLGALEKEGHWEPLGEDGGHTGGSVLYRK